MLKSVRKSVAVSLLLMILCGNFYSANAMEQKIDLVEIKKDEESIGVKIKTTDEIYNPKSYKYIGENSTIGTINDKEWDEQYTFDYNNIEQDKQYSNKMILSIGSKIDKDNLYNDTLTFEFYKEKDFSLQYIGKSNFKKGQQVSIQKTRLDKGEFSDQKYIYIRIGIRPDDIAKEYSGTIMFKVRNPFRVVFKDLENHWAKNDIEGFAEKGYISLANENFRPDDSITRAEFVKIANKAFGFTTKATSENYNDIDPTQWWYEEVLIAINAGYIDTKASNFRPQDKITREEVAAIITSIKDNKDSNLDKSNKYSDFNKISIWAQSSVEGAIEQGYMGKGSNSFRPKDNITRAEAVVTLNRIIK